MSTQESGGGLTKWQIAALIGAPVAAACILGALYYWKSSRTFEEDQDAEKGTEGDKASASKTEVPGNEAPQSDDVSEENLVMWGKKLSFKSSPPLQGPVVHNQYHPSPILKPNLNLLLLLAFINLYSYSSPFF